MQNSVAYIYIYISILYIYTHLTWAQDRLLRAISQRFLQASPRLWMKLLTSGINICGPDPSLNALSITLVGAGFRVMEYNIVKSMWTKDANGLVLLDPLQVISVIFLYLQIYAHDYYAKNPGRKIECIVCSSFICHRYVYVVMTLGSLVSQSLQGGWELKTATKFIYYIYIYYIYQWKQLNYHG